MCKRCLIFALLFLFIVIGAIFFIWNNANGQSGSVVINEIAWMGTTTSTNDEWIELYNTTSSSIDLSNWTLQAHDGMPQINLQGAIPANRYFLLERTDDSSVPAMPADQIYTGALKNTGEILYLYDANNSLVDEVNAWYAGDNLTKQTMERKDPQLAGHVLANWANGPVGGTPRLANSVWQMANGEEQNNTTSNSQNEQLEMSERGNEIPQEVLQFTKTNNVIISEFLPNPQGEDAQGEWIEIYNTGDGSYDLSGWQIDDGEGASSPFIISQGTIIAPRGYIVFARPTTKISLTNTGDTVRLLYPDGTLVYEIIYQEKAREGYSYAFIDDKWVWTNILTPGSVNMAIAKKTSAATQEREATTPRGVETTIVNVEKEDKIKTLTSEQFAAQIVQESSFSPALLIIFLAAGLVSAAAGISFVILKNKRHS